MNFCYVKLYYVHIFISLFCVIKPNGDAVKKLLKLFFLQLSFNFNMLRIFNKSG